MDKHNLTSEDVYALTHTETHRTWDDIVADEIEHQATK